MAGNFKENNYMIIAGYGVQLINLISTKKFDETRIILALLKDHIIKETNLNRMNVNDFNYLIREIRWITETLESTQKELDRYEPWAKKIKTEINLSILLFASLIIRLKLNEDEEGFLLNQYKNEYSPIFTNKSKEKEGFASFSEIKLDEDYYFNEYKRLPDKLKERYPNYANEVKKFIDYIHKKNLEFAKEVGLK